MPPEMASSDPVVTSLAVVLPLLQFCVASDHRSSQLECFIVDSTGKDGWVRKIAERYCEASVWEPGFFIKTTRLGTARDHQNGEMLVRNCETSAGDTSRCRPPE